MEKFRFTQNFWWRVILFLLASIFLAGIQFYFNVMLGWYANQYGELSKSFLHGDLSFSQEYVEQVGAWDMSYSNGKYYWPLGPLPAVLLMPLAFMEESQGIRFAQSGLNIIFALISLCVIFNIARRIGYNEKDSSFWAAAFCFGSTFIGVITFSSSWYLAHTIATTLVLLSLLEYFGKRRYFIIGIFIAGVVATRVTAGVGILFFLLAILFEKGLWQEKARKIMTLMLPLLVIVIVLSFYNYARFGSFSETGYETQLIPDVKVVENRESRGMFSIEHLPRNLHFLLLATPKMITFQAPFSNKIISLPGFDPRGMSLFVTTPWLLLAFTIAYKKRVSWYLLGTAAVIGVMILLWHSTGCVQLGHRLALDFLPFAITAFMIAYLEKHKELSGAFKVLIILGIIFNVLLILTSVFVGIQQDICST